MMRAAFALALALLAPAAFAKEPPPNKALAALFEREFQWILKESPEAATFYGFDGFDDKLSDRSPAAIERRKAHRRAVIAEIKKDFAAVKLSTQDRISRDMALYTLEMEEEEEGFYKGQPFGASNGDGWMQVSPMHGPQQFYGYLAQATRFRDARDYDNYLKRLAALPGKLGQQIDIMRAGLKSGWVPPKAAMQRVPGMFEKLAGSDVTATALWKPFESFPEAVSAADRARITATAREVLSTKVHPAFAAMKRFLEEDYIPKGATSLASADLPGGAAYYAWRVRDGTTTNMKPEQIHEIGLKEVARIRAEMDRVVATTDFKGTFAEFLDFIRTDPRFFFKTPEARLMAYRDIGKRADAELPKLFAELPRVPYGIRPMDPSEGDNADHYTPPALDGSRAGYFDANVNNLTKRPSHEMEATLLHEAVPGHHLQNARAQELQGLPKFRRTIWYPAYGEGWALYAESLGYDMGFYKDPYNNFGRLSSEMLRACRLVIDTGLHSKGWGREQSIKYLAENSGVHPDFAAAEIDRYIVWPGQALSYKVGELKIKELRARASAALGNRFDLRRFHNALLDDGAVPLTVLEARIDEWIASNKGKKS
jgi:uncharacterized protein (DUF885 family)